MGRWRACAAVRPRLAGITAPPSRARLCDETHLQSSFPWRTARSCSQLREKGAVGDAQAGVGSGALRDRGVCGSQLRAWKARNWEPQTPAKGRTAARTSAPRRPGSGLTLRRRGRGVERSAGSSGRRDDGARHHGKSACGSTAGTDGEGVGARSRAASRPGRGPEGLGAEREESQAEGRAGGTQHEHALASARRLPPVGRSRACSLCAVTAAALRAARASIVPVPGPGVEASRAGATPALLAGCPFADRRSAAEYSSARKH